MFLFARKNLLSTGKQASRADCHCYRLPHWAYQHPAALLNKYITLWASLLTFNNFPVICFHLVSESDLGGFGQDNISFTVLWFSFLCLRLSHMGAYSYEFPSQFSPCTVKQYQLVLSSMIQQPLTTTENKRVTYSHQLYKANVVSSIWILQNVLSKKIQQISQGSNTSKRHLVHFSLAPIVPQRLNRK